MKTKEKGEIKKVIPIGEYIIIVAVFSLLVFSILEIASLQEQLNRANLTIAQEHSQILNLTHSLAQANASLSQQKVQIINLTNLLNLNESQVIFNKPISIGPRPLMSSCNNFTCFYYRPAANLTLHFNFSHAGYISINTTSQDNLFIILVQNYSKTWLSTNDTAVIGALNFSVRSLIMPVLPGSAKLTLLTSAYLSNATNVTPYTAQLTITYHN